MFAFQKVADFSDHIYFGYILLIRFPEKPSENYSLSLSDVFWPFLTFDILFSIILNFSFLTCLVLLVLMFLP